MYAKALTFVVISCCLFAVACEGNIQEAKNSVKGEKIKEIVFVSFQEFEMVEFDEENDTWISLLKSDETGRLYMEAVVEGEEFTFRAVNYVCKHPSFGTWSPTITITINFDDAYEDYQGYQRIRLNFEWPLSLGADCEKI